MIRRYAAALSGTTTPLPDPQLTLSVIVAGGFVTFQSFLSRVVDADIVVNRIFADNFISCGSSAQGSLQRNIDYTIPAGGTGGTFAYEIISGTVNTSKNRVYNVIINGTVVNNGDNITVGTFTVNVVLEQCS
jgi:hypothetical protein